MAKVAPIDEPQDEQIVVNGSTYNLRFSTRAWASLVKLWGLNNVQEAQAHLQKIGDATQIEPIVDVFWASLQRHHPDISREQADNLADDAGVEKLAAVLPRLIRAANPQTQAGAKKNPGKQPNRR